MISIVYVMAIDEICFLNHHIALPGQPLQTVLDIN